MLAFYLIWFSSCVNSNYEPQLRRHCVDKYNNVRSINSSWFMEGCRCICKEVGNESVLKCERCLRSKQHYPNPHLWINPNSTSAYFYNEESDLGCEPGFYVKDFVVFISVNSTEIRKHSPELISIGGYNNKSNQTICGNCTYFKYVSPNQCYHIIESKPLFIIRPESLPYYPESIPDYIKCDTIPANAIDYYQEITLWTNPNFTKSTYKNDQVYPGHVCFECRHPKIKQIGRCYISYEIIVPTYQSVYYFDEKTKVYCQPNELEINLNTSEMNRKSSNMVAIGGMYNKSNKTICVFCSKPNVFNYYTQCFKMIETKPFLIVRPGGNCYPVGIPITVLCDTDPASARMYYSKFHLHLTGSQDSHSGYLDGKNIGDVCFSCLQQGLTPDGKCFQPFVVGQVNLSVVPRIHVYLTGIVTVFKCLFQPNLYDSGETETPILSHINATTTERTPDNATINGDDQGVICVNCTHPWAPPAIQCYQPFPINKLKILVFPDYSKIYLANETVYITCGMDPKDIYIESLVSQLVFLSNNSTVPQTSPSLIVFDGRNVGKICFTCGSVLLKVVWKCFDYYDNIITVSIAPDDITIFVADNPMVINCSVQPEEIIADDLISGIDFVFNNSTSSATGEREVTITGADRSTICFKCGQGILKNATRCYDYYDKPLNFVIEPSYTDIYLPNDTVDIMCIIEPQELITENLASDFGFISHNSSGEDISPFLIRFEGENLGKICFTCGHAILKVVSKCYDYYDGPIETIIIPSDYELPYEAGIELKCRHTPRVFNYSILEFKIMDFPKEDYSLDDKLVMSLPFDMKYTGKEICVLCGNVNRSNITKCFKLVGGFDNRFKTYLFTALILASLILVMLYIYTFEVL